MLVLKIIGFVFLGIIALILLLLSVRVRIFAEYSEIDTRVMLQWLFIKIPLFPAEKKEKNDKTEKAETTPGQVTSAEEVPPGEEPVTEEEVTGESVEDSAMQTETSESLHKSLLYLMIFMVPMV